MHRDRLISRIDRSVSRSRGSLQLYRIFDGARRREIRAYIDLQKPANGSASRSRSSLSVQASLLNRQSHCLTARHVRIRGVEIERTDHVRSPGDRSVYDPPDHGKVSDLDRDGVGDVVYNHNWLTVRLIPLLRRNVVPGCRDLIGLEAKRTKRIDHSLLARSVLGSSSSSRRRTRLNRYLNIGAVRINFDLA